MVREYGLIIPKSHKTADGQEILPDEVSQSLILGDPGQCHTKLSRFKYYGILKNFTALKILSIK